MSSCGFPSPLESLIFSTRTCEFTLLPVILGIQGRPSIWCTFEEAIITRDLSVQLSSVWKRLKWSKRQCNFPQFFRWYAQSGKRSQCVIHRARFFTTMCDVILCRNLVKASRIFSITQERHAIEPQSFKDESQLKLRSRFQIYWNKRELFEAVVSAVRPCHDANGSSSSNR